MSSIIDTDTLNQCLAQVNLSVRECIHTGEGNLDAVFKASHLSTGRQFSIKIVSPEEGVVGADRIKQACQKATTITGIQHPNLAGVIYSAEFQGRLMVVLEWVEGITLRQWLEAQKEPVVPDVGLNLIRQIGAGLQALHNNGVIHQDLRPDNILLDAANGVKIAGYGFDAVVNPKAATTKLALSYKPRDYKLALSIGDNPEITPAIDTFSLGTISYEILAGQLPEGQMWSLPSKHCGCENWIDDVVLRAMHHNAKDRYPTATEFLVAIEGGGKKSVVVEEPTPVPVHIQRRQRQVAHHTSGGTFTKIALLVFSLVMVGGALSIGYFYKSNGEQFMEETQSLIQKIALASSWVSAGDREEGLKQIAEAMMQAEGDPIVVEEAIDALIEANAYEMAVDSSVSVLKGLDLDHPSYRDVKRLVDDVKKRVSDYMAAVSVADEAWQNKNFKLERQYLQNALRIMPNDNGAAQKLMRSPYAVEETIRFALEEVRKANSFQPAWHYNFQVDDQNRILDLSDHSKLEDIQALAGLPLTRLDLSHTRVHDLSSLANMPLTELHLDATEVSDLSVLEGMPLEILTFVNSPAEDVSTVLASQQTLRVLRYGTKGRRQVRISPPLVGERWENSLGMRFVPVDGSEVLFSVWESRVDDFRAFVESSGHRASGRTMVIKDNRWQAENTSWDRPGFPISGRDPVVGLSLNDAKAFCRWLTEEELKKGIIRSPMRYRLPTDEEWSLAAGIKPGQDSADMPPRYLWGTAWPPPDRAANLSGSEVRSKLGNQLKHLWDYEDPYVYTSPVGRFIGTNGIFDLDGNVREWCRDVFGISTPPRY
ncbi:MAG: SUMF1/EgtB/PvdO family nonheme iron enzyme, partial [Verrucomicrobiota bacterium]